MTVDELNSGVFQPCLHSTFQIELPGSDPLAVELCEVVEKNSPRQEQFWVIFRGPMTPVLPQGLYTIGHAQIGRFELFLVPIGPWDEGMGYQAVFNRVRRPPGPDA